jgi:HK97 gp10 family phage protein
MSKTTVIGLDSLVKALDDLGPAMQGKKGFPKNAIRNAARGMANTVKKSAAAKAPFKTGRLKEALAVKLLSVRYRDAATLGGNSLEYYYVGHKTGMSRRDKKGAYYGWMLEVGTDRQPAQPHLRPALEENKSELVAGFKSKLTRDIENIRKKLNSRSRARMTGRL